MRNDISALLEKCKSSQQPKLLVISRWLQLSRWVWHLPACSLSLLCATGTQILGPGFPCAFTVEQEYTWSSLGLWVLPFVSLETIFLCKDGTCLLNTDNRTQSFCHLCFLVQDSEWKWGFSGPCSFLFRKRSHLSPLSPFENYKCK